MGSSWPSVHYMVSAQQAVIHVGETTKQLAGMWGRVPHP